MHTVRQGVLAAMLLGLVGASLWTGFPAQAKTPALKPSLPPPAGAARRPDALIPVGSPAPAFDLLATGGKRVRLADLKGRPVVIVFYPMDQTPGCTVQLCALRDHYSQFQAHRTAILASNPASLQSHEAFAKAHKYPFPILVDDGQRMAKAYGSAGMLGMNQRTVYILDGQGVVRFAERGMPSNAQLLKVIQSLSTARN